MAWEFVTHTQEYKHNFGTALSPVRARVNTESVPILYVYISNILVLATFRLICISALADLNILNLTKSPFFYFDFQFGFLD